ncbi:MAG TPA: hypothetical protein VK013_01890 [Myxococcaceae bacterium]|nr:hypothetical protein [Myxococcaceae bacterium]
MPKRYPLRTVILMIVALAAFGRLWCLTHPPGESEQTPTSSADPVRPTPPTTPPAPQGLGPPAQTPSGGEDDVPSEGTPKGPPAPEADDARAQETAEPPTPSAPGEVR